MPGNYDASIKRVIRCYRRDYLRTTVAMPARIFGDDFSLGDGLEDGSAHQ